MSDFLDKLLKIRSEYFKRMRLLFILDLIAIFSIFYAIFIILSVDKFLEKSSLEQTLAIIISLATAFIIAIIIAFLLHRKDHKINVTLITESKYPELREKLRTAYDNRDETNIIVDSLKSLVSDALDKASASQLLSRNKIFSKILIAIIFIVFTVMVNENRDIVSIPPDTIANNFKNITGIGKGPVNETVEVVGRPADFEKASTTGGGEIFGKPKIASIEGKNIDLTIYSSMGPGFEVREASQTRNQFIKSAAFPVDVLGSNVSDGGYSILMKKTETEKELINKYAVEISKI